MARRKVTLQYFNDLFVDLMSGDSEAETLYREEARKLFKRVNQQMRVQEKEEVFAEGYYAAQDALGYSRDDILRGEHGRFLENVNRIASLDIVDLRDQIDAAMSYSNARDYSIKYARQAKKDIENLTKSLTAAGFDIRDERVSFWTNELFKTGAWREYKKAHGDSSGILRAAHDQFANGKTVDDLLDAYNDYAEGRDDSPDLVQSWESFAPNSW